MFISVHVCSTKRMDKQSLILAIKHRKLYIYIALDKEQQKPESIFNNLDVLVNCANLIVITILLSFRLLDTISRVYSYFTACCQVTKDFNYGYDESINPK